MKFFQYWANAETTAQDAKGKTLKLRKWAGSDSSVDDAARNARRAVEDLAARIATIATNLSHNYAYGTGGRPEELVDRIGTVAALTRNRTGCLVLNADQAMFVDIDMLNGGRGFFAWLFGRSEKKYRQRLEAWLAAHPEAGVRIYRTAAGMRYLMTHMPLPVNETTMQWLSELGSDKLYAKLCRAQDCYRARLTPKAYRLKMQYHDQRFPYENDDIKRKVTDWLNRYKDESQNYAVCKLVETLGETYIHRDLQDIVKAHDNMTRVEHDLPLA